MPGPATHLVHVVLEVDDPAHPTIVRLPVWTPGSYMVREFARHVEDFRAYDSDGRAQPWRKDRKDTWIIDARPGWPLRVEFDVFAHDLTVRTSHLDVSHAFLNPANLLPYLPGRTGEPLGVTVEVLAGWSLETGLSRDDGAADSFLARDYDELVDCPLHAGTDPIYPFEAGGVPHRVATWGRGNLNPEQLVGDVARIVEAAGALFGGLPYERYLFILLLTDGPRGGLEHRNSTAVMLPRFGFRPGKPYERALQLLCHEFFHIWNVKRIRSEVLGPFDYSEENYTRLLWAMEGITEYYTSLLLRRAGLLTPERYLEILGEQMSELADTPGRHLQSLEEASFDAWIKYYRPDEHSPNSSISYYLKGALASLLLDLEMRRRTNGARSLDDLMRLLWERYGNAARGIPEGGYQAAVEEVAGGNWEGFFDHAIRGRGDLDYGPALAAAGLDLDRHTDANSPTVWLGLRTRTENGRTRIAHIMADGPAWDSGISAGDELLALDGYRIDESSLNDRLRDLQPGDTVTLSLFRRDELVHVPIMVAARPASRASLRKVKRPTVRQRTLYEGWMGAPW